MRAYAALIVLTLAACAMLSSHAHKPFELRIDAPDTKPASWPTNAAVRGAGRVMLTPCSISPQNWPLAQPERKT